MSHLSPFSPDYFTARRRFAESARAAGARVESVATGQTGPNGEVLSIEIARLGDVSASRVLVLSSGLHGVEGFFGSAVQLRVLQTLGSYGGAPRNTSIVLIHALDAYGFAHLRRFDENNVDLNRNFLLDGDAYHGCSPRYAELDGFLNPHYPPARWDAFRIRAYASVLRHGFNDLKAAVVGGQYEFARGLFFGGHAPSATRLLLEARLADWIGRAEQVLHLDFHTGLGRWGHYELLVEDCVDAHRRAQLGARFGEDRVRGTDVEGISYPVRGGLSAWCEALFPDRSYTVLCAEFGTYGPLTVLGAMRAENQAHHWGDPSAPSTKWAKSNLKEVFTPADPFWRQTAVDQAIGLVRRALPARIDLAAEAQREFGR
jgi:hypothetical protein